MDVSSIREEYHGISVSPREIAVKDERPAPPRRNNRDEVEDFPDGSDRGPGRADDFPADGSSQQSSSPETDEFQLLLRQLKELGAYFVHYLSAKADGVTLGLRTVVVVLAAVAIAFIVTTCSAVMATSFVLYGAAGGLSELFGGRPWAGSLATGVLFAVVLGIGTSSLFRRLKKSGRKRLVAKYEQQPSRMQEGPPR